MQKEEEDEEDVDEEEEDEDEEEMVEEEDYVSSYIYIYIHVYMFIRKRVEILCSGCRFRNQAFVISFGNWQFWKNEDDEMEGDYTESQLEEIQAQTQTEDDDDDDVIQLDGELLFVKTI